MITVFTPTYNRKDNLKELYKSLLNQNSNFEWLIIDDGSTDDTKEYINSLKKDNKINIRYYYQKNGGKQSAYNKALDKAKGDIFFAIDSDDLLRANALSTIEKDFKDLKEAGIMYNQGYINNKNKIIGTYFKDGLTDTYFNIYKKHNVKGDKLIVLKTNIAKEYYFPMIDNEKFIAEALIYNRMSQKYNFVCKNKTLAYKEYLENGYSANYFNLVKNNPKGNVLYYKEAYTLNPSLYNIYGYLLYSFYAKEKASEFIKNHPAKIKTILLYLPVLLISKIKR